MEIPSLALAFTIRFLSSEARMTATMIVVVVALVCRYLARVEE
jgi:hypothetical protein